MRIDPSQRIAGLPALRVRDALRRMWSHGDCNIPLIARLLGVSERRAQRAIQELVRADLIEPSPQLPGHYSRTDAGARLGSATGRRPIRRETADLLLRGVVERAQWLATWQHPFAFAVRELRVFGSYLSDVERLGDLDLAAEWMPRFVDPKRQREYTKARIRLAFQAGRRFSSISEEYGWPFVEVHRFLKNRRPAISLHDLAEEGELLRRVPHRAVFRATEVAAIPPLDR